MLGGAGKLKRNSGFFPTMCCLGFGRRMEKNRATSIQDLMEDCLVGISLLITPPSECDMRPVNDCEPWTFGVVRIC